MLKAAYTRYILNFHEPATTSRSTMKVKETYFVKVWDDSAPEVYGVGECALFRGLSHDDHPGYEKELSELCRKIHQVNVHEIPYSSMRFGIETALLDLANGGKFKLYDTPWSRSKMAIKINGLVWMGNHDEMLERIKSKVDSGFRCLKLKIGGIGFDEEIDLIKHIRDRFSPKEVELRLDANEAFTTDNVMEKLNRLADYSIHSIEQPIKRGQWAAMSHLAQNSPIAIALDEELIGCRSVAEKFELLRAIKPQYIILKPSLCGGLTDASQWIEIAESMGIGWWATSALESNVGLNAIAQWVSKYQPALPQGLGTGMLYSNNIPSPLRLRNDGIELTEDGKWELSALSWKS